MRKIKNIDAIEQGNVLLIDRRKQLVDYKGATYLSNILVYQIFVCHKKESVSNQMRLDGTIKYLWNGDSYKIQSSKIMQKDLILKQGKLILKREQGFKNLTEDKFNDNMDIYKLNKKESGEVMAKVMLYKISK